jgi:acetyl-CoA C-acetyltransferase
MATAAEDPIVIVSAARSAIGGFQGAFAPLTAPQLGSAAIRAAVSRAGLRTEDVSEVLMGCVLPAGQGQAPARQAALGAGLPPAVPCTTVNKMCGSGMKTVMLAYDGLHARPNDIVVAGGMESMTNAPYLLAKMRGGARLGHAQVQDHMFLDGLEDAYDKGRLMGSFAEDCAQSYQFTRAAQDAFASESLQRARKANEDGSFAAEIVPVSVQGRTGERQVKQDEQPFTADPARIAKLKPAFREGGTVTAANSSSISDGAAALVLMRQSQAASRQLKPIARLVGVASAAQAPALFTTAPVAAIKTLLATVGWSSKDVGLFEINEAFAVQVLAFLDHYGIADDDERVNQYGGAIAFGHPLASSGVRLMTQLARQFEEQPHVRYGLTTMCVGFGMGATVIWENPHFEGDK